MPIPYLEEDGQSREQRQAQLHSQVRTELRECHGQLVEVTVLPMGCSGLASSRVSLVKKVDLGQGDGRRKDAADQWLERAEAATHIFSSPGGTERVERESNWSLKMAMEWAAGDLG